MPLVVKAVDAIHQAPATHKQANRHTRVEPLDWAARQCVCLTLHCTCSSKDRMRDILSLLGMSRGRVGVTHELTTPNNATHS
jgi:hypothetical protein